MSATAQPIASRNGQHDFDFLFGSWAVKNRRLREALSGNGEWLEFTATSTARRVWGGLSNLDEYEALETPWGSIHGLTLRLYDPRSQQWSIYWANRNNGRLDSPMTGAWHDGSGVFSGQDVHRGKTIDVRFLWTCPAPDLARWEQSFSDDGGQSWESNWVMSFERLP